MRLSEREFGGRFVLHFLHGKGEFGGLEWGLFVFGCGRCVIGGLEGGAGVASSRSFSLPSIIPCP